MKVRVAVSTDFESCLAAGNRDRGGDRIDRHRDGIVCICSIRVLIASGIGELAAGDVDHPVWQCCFAVGCGR